MGPCGAFTRFGAQNVRCVALAQATSRGRPELNKRGEEGFALLYSLGKYLQEEKSDSISPPESESNVFMK